MKRFCKECGTPLDLQRGICPKCEYPRLQRPQSPQIQNSLLEQQPRKKKTDTGKILWWILLAAAALALVAGAILLALYVLNPGQNGDSDCSHRWESATCTEPKTCTRCGQTQGSPRDHRWEEATCQHPSICTRCQKTQGEKLEHNWYEGRCSLCGRYQNQEAETPAATQLPETQPPHSWQDATCTTPQTCAHCAQTIGEALGHNWQDATMDAPMTCTRCGSTQGSPLSAQKVDITAEIQKIKDFYYDVRERVDRNEYTKVTLGDGVVAYRDQDANTVIVVVYRGTEGIGQYSDTYSRTYYFDDGQLVFAFFEGVDSHRLYFYEGNLMRWKYRQNNSTPAVDHDFENSGEFILWETLALEEVETFF